ncbi:NAD-dependent epimerase/dehydratase family protein [Cerasicoccus maritimus]|uniref:NAD-dependent epimerase/dehydratase family protein n=1 Tax=Cerasicoccus maritimus TaxID=490089 RepID=UPI0028526C40|nr:NAD-dependent epimerase/dehydratase family protein [Cerasicoccus maritimus]
MPKKTSSSRRVLVTGGAGFIGSHTVDQLLAENVDVLVVDNLATGRIENLDAACTSPSFRFEQIDVTHSGTLSRILEAFQPHAIIHLAALVSVQESIENPALNFKRNVLATQTIIDAAQRGMVENIVFASSAAIYGDNPELPLQESAKKQPLSPYGGAKLASEALLLAAANTYKLKVTANRYFNVYGPRQDPKSPYSGVMSIFLDRFAQGVAPIVFGDGQQTRDFINVQDVARMNVLATKSNQSGFNAVNVCTGKSTSLLDILDELRLHFPDAPETVFKEARTGDIIHSLGCPNSARELLDFTASISLREGLAQYLQSTTRSSALLR